MASCLNLPFRHDRYLLQIVYRDCLIHQFRVLLLQLLFRLVCRCLESFVLLVHVQEIGCRGLPDVGQLPDRAKIQETRDRPSAVVIRVAVGRADDFSNAGKAIGQFIHPGMGRGPKADRMAALREKFHTGKNGLTVDQILEEDRVDRP